MIGPNGLSDIFDLLLAEISEDQAHLGAYMVPNNTRDANRTRLRKSLQPGRDFDGIAEKILALHDDNANVDADAEPHLLIRRSICILLGDGVLHRDSTLNCIHGAGEIGDEAVTRRVEDPTAMRGDQAIDNDPVSRERAEGADLILPHEAAVALDVGCEYRGELSFDGARFQPRHLPTASIARLRPRSERLSGAQVRQVGMLPEQQK
jgi:hypothetical protein